MLTAKSREYSLYSSFSFSECLAVFTGQRKKILHAHILVHFKGGDDNLLRALSLMLAIKVFFLKNGLFAF